MTFRKKLIKLAYDNPELRSDILPLLKSSKKKHQMQFEVANQLSKVDPAIAKVMVQSGSPSKDKISVKPAKGMSAVKLKPSQTTMVLEKALDIAFKMLITGTLGGDLGAIVSKDNYIMDGHHRWAASIIAGGKKAKVGGWRADLDGKNLVRVLNLLTKGQFNVMKGNEGKGALSQFTKKNAETMLWQLVKTGTGGEYPKKAKDIQAGIERQYGSLAKGIDIMSSQAAIIGKSKIPSWAVDRVEMPVIDAKNVPEAAAKMNKGDVEWKGPWKEASDLEKLWFGKTAGGEVLQQLKSMKGFNGKIEWNDVFEIQSVSSSVQKMLDNGRRDIAKYWGMAKKMPLDHEYSNWVITKIDEKGIECTHPYSVLFASMGGWNSNAEQLDPKMLLNASGFGLAEYTVFACDKKKIAFVATGDLGRSVWDSLSPAQKMGCEERDFKEVKNVSSLLRSKEYRFYASSLNFYIPAWKISLSWQELEKYQYIDESFLG